MSSHMNKINVQIKPTQYITPMTDQCVFCYQTYSPEQSIAKCEHCKQTLHFDCQMTWMVESITNDNSPTCPFCRRVWENSNYRYLLTPTTI